MSKFTRSTLVLLLLCVVSAGAEVPQRTSYQGRLLDNSDIPLTGNFDLTFTIYDDSTGGAIFYQETHTAVPVDNGFFNVLIGGKSFVTPFNDYVFIGKDRFLGIQVGVDPELSPRTRLVTAPYAFRVATVDSAGGGAIAGKLKIIGDAYVEGDLGVGQELPNSGVPGSVGRLIEIESPNLGAGNSDATLTLTEGASGTSWDILARSLDGTLGMYANGGGLFYIESNGDVGMGSATPSTGKVNIASRVLEINAPADGADNSGAAVTLVDGGAGYAWDIVATSSFGNNLAIYANSQALIHVEPNGDVGLNSSTPSTGVVNVASRVLEIKAPFAEANNSGAALTLSDGSFGSSWDIIATSSAGGLGIYGNSNQVMYMQPGGNVGIGTSSPSVELHVSGDICYTGSIGACSDARYKREVQPLEGSLDKIKQLRGVSYHWNQEEYPDRKFDDNQHLGFIAQEIESLFPEMVLTDDNGYKSVDYGRLTPVLVEAIKDQQRQIDELRILVLKMASKSDHEDDAVYGQK